LVSYFSIGYLTSNEAKCFGSDRWIYIPL